MRRPAHHALHLSLVFALARTAEAVLEQMVGLKLGEGPGALSPAVPQYLSHRQLGVVVQDAPGYSAQEGERRDVAVQESLGGPLHSADDHPGLAEVALGVSRRMGLGDYVKKIWQKGKDSRDHRFIAPPNVRPF